jgi:hypothetical protein
MQRDLNLIRLLLLQVESGEKPEGMSRYTEAQILYHCALAVEAGLLQGRIRPGSESRAGGAMIDRLTWTGHDFLDAARSDTLWNHAQDTIRKKGGAWTFELVTELLKSLLRESLFA